MIRAMSWAETCPSARAISCKGLLVLPGQQKATPGGGAADANRPLTFAAYQFPKLTQKGGDYLTPPGQVHEWGFTPPFSRPLTPLHTTLGGCFLAEMTQNADVPLWRNGRRARLKIEFLHRSVRSSRTRG